jgi:hypothetical protein
MITVPFYISTGELEKLIFFNENGFKRMTFKNRPEVSLNIFSVSSWLRLWNKYSDTFLNQSHFQVCLEQDDRPV